MPPSSKGRAKATEPESNRRGRRILHVPDFTCHLWSRYRWSEQLKNLTRREKESSRDIQRGRRQREKSKDEQQRLNIFINPRSLLVVKPTAPYPPHCFHGDHPGLLGLTVKVLITPLCCISKAFGLTTWLSFWSKWNWWWLISTFPRVWTKGDGICGNAFGKVNFTC